MNLAEEGAASSAEDQWRLLAEVATSVLRSVRIGQGVETLSASQGTVEFSSVA